ncbi:MAG TPA: hypothetical protein VLA72_06765 [Anaerolineales bacterium]|nr:hypothetical protein [Anaerolineales bacterium]
MAAKTSKKFYLDPINELDHVLDHTWRILCYYFDAGGNLPDIQSLFMGAELTNPRRATETVIANMIFDLAESICRFSPWYTKPTRAFGISVIRDLETKSVRCVLAPEAAQKWADLIEPLATSIQKNLGVIQAILYVENMVGDDPDDVCVTVKCGCIPQHTINVSKSALEKTKIYCNICKLPFR